MTVYKLTTSIYVESDKGPEDIATSMHGGLESALAGFPDGEVIYANVEGIEVATEKELDEYGLTEV